MLKEVMDVAAKRIADGELKSAPEAELRLRMTIGNVYSEIAERDAAEKILAPTLDLAEKELARITREQSGDHPELAQSLSVYGECLLSAGRGPEALQNVEKALAMRRRLFQGDNEYVAQSLSDVGSCLTSLNRRADALPFFQESLAMRKRLYPEGHADVVATLLSLGSCFD